MSETAHLIPNPLRGYGRLPETIGMLEFVFQFGERSLLISSLSCGDRDPKAQEADSESDEASHGRDEGTVCGPRANCVLMEWS